MKAIIQESYGEDVLKVGEVDKPKPSDKHVLVKVKATAINDWDVALKNGDQLIIRLMNGFNKPKLRTPGMEVAGVVESVGNSISKFKPGDRVYGDLSESSFGTFAEYVNAKEDALTIIPDNISFNEAAALPHASMLAYQSLFGIGKVTNGMKILINGGGGGVGSLGIQMIKEYDVDVTGVDSKKKLQEMLDWGFDHVIDYQTTDFTEEGTQYDLILDTKTTRSPWRLARALKPGGLYVTVGGMVPVLLRLLLASPLIKLTKNKSIKVLGLKPNKGMDKLNRLIEAGKINCKIDGPYQLEDIPRLVSYFERGEHVGKIVIQIDGK